MEEPKWDEILAKLRAPFAPSAIKFKPQATTQDQSKGLVVFYVDARLIAARLNAAVGVGGWCDEYQVISHDPKLGLPVECRLTVLGVTKADVGQLASAAGVDEKAWKSTYSDALKRAAVKFGLGAYLYVLPSPWVETKVGRNGKAQGFTEAGQAAARKAYESWLKSPANTYGDPIDHGEVEPVRETPPEDEGGSTQNQTAAQQNGAAALEVGDRPASGQEVADLISLASTFSPEVHEWAQNMVTAQREHYGGQVSAKWLKEKYQTLVDKAAKHGADDGAVVTDGSPEADAELERQVEQAFGQEAA